MPAGGKIKIDYKPNKRQDLFHSSAADECFYGGAKGGGKSKGLVIDATWYALKYQGSDPHLFRETYDALEGNLIKEFLEGTPRDIFEYNKSDHIATMCNGSVIKFRYVSNEIDAAGYDGRSIPYFGLDEITKHTERTVQRLASCVRTAHRWPVYSRFTGNPGGIGHVHTKKRFVTPTKYGKVIYEDPITGNIIEFVPATVYDNDVLMKNDPAYARRLENLPENQKQALLYGNWDIFEGQFFGNFGPHLREKPFKIEAKDTEGRLFGSMDYGYGLYGISSFGLWWLDEQDVPHRLKTWYREGLTASEQADDLFDDISSFWWSDYKLPKWVVCDTNMFPKGRNTPGEKAPVDYFKERFGGKVKWIPANKNRENGWDAVLDYFQPHVLTGAPKLYYWPEFNGTFAENIPQLIHDPNNPKDLLKCDIDHVADETRYFLIQIGKKGDNYGALVDKKNDYAKLQRQVRIAERDHAECATGY